MKSITVIDYGIGNIRSAIKALETVGFSVTFSGDPQVISRSDRILLPGVGAFQPAMKKLESLGVTNLLRDHAARNRPLLGICLGMQLLAAGSEEFGYYPGLGLLDTRITAFKDLPKIPHMGWNQLLPVTADPLFRNVQEGDYVYFVHSYYAPSGKQTLAETDYFGRFSSVMRNGNVVGMQFHPEKSQTTGLTLLKNFGEL
ncbi:MAG: imidazole glycerol phosphate synthase subunit HisH [Bacteroidetes bacterium]|nr:imidazole glycerol phosphate synthase subunit HisH [Bacteroidota bacterium]